MTWLQRYLGALITLAALVLGGAIGYGRLCQTASAVQAKADKETVQREMDQVSRRLERIEQKIDTLILQRK